MSLSFYFDESVPNEVFRAAKQSGLDAMSAREDGMSGAHDVQILVRAWSVYSRVLVTSDVDFLSIAAELLERDQLLQPIVFCPQNSLALADIIADLSLIAQAATPKDFAYGVLHLPLR